MRDLTTGVHTVEGHVGALRGGDFVVQSEDFIV